MCRPFRNFFFLNPAAAVCGVEGGGGQSLSVRRADSVGERVSLGSSD